LLIYLVLFTGVESDRLYLVLAAWRECY